MGNLGLVAALAAAILAGSVQGGPLRASPFDGKYLNRDAVRAGHISCATAGQWDWTILDGNRLLAGEGGCYLHNPVEVRAMPALLYDADCAVEGTEFRKRFFIMKQNDGLMIVSDGWVDDLVYCYPAIYESE